MKKANSREEATSYEFDSSVIKKAMYNHTSQQLTVEFNNGSTYLYEGVEARVFNDFVEADSQGMYFAENIKESYSYTKL